MKNFEVIDCETGRTVLFMKADTPLTACAIVADAAGYPSPEMLSAHEFSYTAQRARAELPRVLATWVPDLVPGVRLVECGGGVVEVHALTPEGSSYQRVIDAPPMEVAEAVRWVRGQLAHEGEILISATC